MPKEGKSELVQLLSSMEEELTLPAQAMYNSVALIDKPDGGDRPITLLSMLYRLLIRARRSYITKWDAEKARPWDSAVAGSGALEAAYSSELEN
eukprot:5017719-Heterocapsa_arctica.AAC.1